ncbi:MAG: methyltransferase domain-containing protein [Myxococcales bacterium]|nr:methyltransferase domain-containing protein [Myxococcales bacterium]
MDLDDPRQRTVFFELHQGLPREGPGSRSCTRRALERVGPLPPAPAVLDVACGPGMQTLDLALLLPQARITAVDLHPGFVQEARRRVQAQGWDDRIEVLEGDMRALPFGPASFDLVWCEGAAYIMGLTDALRAWAPLLRDHGRIALTEIAWLRDDVPAALREGWEADYPAMTDVEGCRTRVREAGLVLVDDFVLPESAWWDDYYRPLEARLEQLERTHAGDPAAEVVLQGHRDEIEMYRELSTYYGYVFFVLKLPE